LWNRFFASGRKTIDMMRRKIWKTLTSLRYPKIFRLQGSLEESQWWSRDQIRELQWSKLKALVAHAYADVPFYRRTWSEIGFHPDDLTPDSFRQLPLLKKQTIKLRADDLVCRELLRNARFNSTGGSTGEPIQFYQDRGFPSIFYAAAFRHNRWSGWRPGDPVLRLWGNPSDLGGAVRQRISRIISGGTTINAFKLSEESFERARHFLETTKPTLLTGYSSAVVAFAEYLGESGRTIEHNLRGIITSAEVLTPEMRRKIQQVFKVRVYDRYGCREVGLIASQCEYGSLHVNDENLLVEYEETTGGLTEIIVTDLNNRVMPFIRYKIGDVGRSSIRNCGCGRGLTVMGEVSGRTTELLLNADGGIISGPALTLVFKDLREVRQVQLFQPRAGELIVRLVRDGGYSHDTEGLILGRLLEIFGARMQIQFEYPDVIASESSGKYRFAISNVHN